MRLRYSVRILLIATVLVAICLYILFVRPTVIANRFIDALGRHDYDKVQSLCAGATQSYVRDILIKADAARSTVKATLLPREPKDTWAFQRALLLEIKPAASRQGQRTVAYQSRSVATIWEIKDVVFRPVLLHP